MPPPCCSIAGSTGWRSVRRREWSLRRATSCCAARPWSTSWTPSGTGRDRVGRSGHPAGREGPGLPGISLAVFGRGVHTMKQALRYGFGIAVVGVLLGLGLAYAQAQKPSSYMPVVITEDFAATMAKMKAAKPEVMRRQRDLLSARYDLGSRAAAGVTMARGKSVQEGVRVKL